MAGGRGERFWPRSRKNLPKPSEKRLRLTQQDIADRSGMKAPNVTRIESRKYSPSLDVLMRYARAVGKDIQFNLIDKDNK